MPPDKITMGLETCFMSQSRTSRSIHTVSTKAGCECVAHILQTPDQDGQLFCPWTGLGRMISSPETLYWKSQHICGRTRWACRTELHKLAFSAASLARSSAWLLVVASFWSSSCISCNWVPCLVSSVAILTRSSAIFSKSASD